MTQQMSPLENPAVQAACKAWDELDNAVHRILCSQPCAMTDAADQLEHARVLMRIRFKQLIMPMLPEESR